MSTCISSYGEYDSHEPDADGYCDYCGALDLAAHDRKVRALTLRAVAEEAKIRGDIGKPHGMEAEDWLRHWAAAASGKDADLAELSITRLLERATRQDQS